MKSKYDISSNVCMGAIKDPRKYAYMLEVNPWVQNEELKDALLYRGAIVAAWGCVETLLTEILIRSSHMDEYCSFRNQYPYPLDKRISYARQVLAADGPFQKYSVRGAKLLDRFDNARRLRDQMAHGHMQVLQGFVTFTDFRTNSNETVCKYCDRYSLSDLQKKARKATQLSRLFQKAYYTLNQQDWLPRQASTD